MIVIVLIPYKTIGKYNLSKPVIRIISKLKSRLGKELKKKSPDTFLTIGFLNGFLPCGLVYMAIFGALTSSTFYEGALYMALFGLGTVPLMSTVVLIGNVTSVINRRRIQQLICLFLVFVFCS